MKNISIINSPKISCGPQGIDWLCGIQKDIQPYIRYPTRYQDQYPAYIEPGPDFRLYIFIPGPSLPESLAQELLPPQSRYLYGSHPIFNQVELTKFI